MITVRTMPFDCPKIGDRVYVDIETNTHPSGQASSKTIIRCSHGKECGVGIMGKPGSWTFDWDQCPVRKAFSR